MSTYQCISSSNQLYTRSLQTDQETYDMPWISDSVTYDMPWISDSVRQIVFWLYSRDNFSTNITPELLPIKYCTPLYPRAFAETWNSNCQNGLQGSWLFDTSCWKCVSMVILSIIKALLTIRNIWWLVVTFSLLTSLVSDSAPKMLHIIWQTQSMFNNQYHHWPSKRDRCNISN